MKNCGLFVQFKSGGRMVAILADSIVSVREAMPVGGDPEADGKCHIEYGFYATTATVCVDHPYREVVQVIEDSYEIA